MDTTKGSNQMATPSNSNKGRAKTAESLDAAAPMQRFHPHSRANRIAALEAGESIAEAKRLDIDESARDEISIAVDDLKSTMSKAAVLAAQRSGNTYITEIGQFFTRSGDIIVTAVVTRTA